MRSFGQMLQEDCAHVLDPTSQDHLIRIIDSAQRMDQLITDVFNFSTSMREGFELSRLNPQALLTEMVKSYPELDPERADIHIAENFPDVRANRAGLTQCFSNLLNNAVKFAKPGQKPVIRVWSEEHDHLIRLWFEDEGIGIEPRHHERIFEMFQKLDSTSRGTGIGLALIRKAVEKMDGHVGVESEPGHGSRFWIDLRPAEVHELQPA
jgi:signal transduction histidine kinase